MLRLSLRRSKASFLLATLLFLPSLQQAQCWSPNFSSGMVFKTTGDPQLDQKFNTEASLIYRVFGVNPNMVVFDDGSSPLRVKDMPSAEFFKFTRI